MVDHYALDVQWENQVINTLSKSKKNKPKLFVIDDLADRQHNPDVLLDQNFFGTSLFCRYTKLLPSSAKCLLGPHYALLPVEYSRLGKTSVQSNSIKRILIYFGGGVPTGLLTKSLQALNLSLFDSLDIDVITGPSQDKNYLDEINCFRNIPNIRFHTFVPSLAPFICILDLFIELWSLTWERLCLSIPTIAISTAENQYNILESPTIITTLISWVIINL